MSAKIYIEGGGEGSALHEAFRRAWADFFKKAGITNRPRVIRGGGRSTTWRDFLAAEGNKADADVVLLLVDSEEVPTQGKTVWAHLAETEADRWQTAWKLGSSRIPQLLRQNMGASSTRAL